MFEKLGGVEDAEFSNAKRGPGCIAGSRVSLLAMLLVWATDPSSPHLFWLSGLAGTGKTAVSKTFCSQLNNRKLLGASFFCMLKESNQRDVYLIIPTLAYAVIISVGNRLPPTMYTHAPPELSSSSSNGHPSPLHSPCPSPSSQTLTLTRTRPRSAQSPFPGRCAIQAPASHTSSGSRSPA